MTERYEKRGTSIRVESSARGKSEIRLREGGWSERSGDRFSCGVIPPVNGRLSTSTVDAANAIVDTVRGFAGDGVSIERQSVVEGTASHLLIDGSTRRRWDDRAARIFVSIVRNPGGGRASLSLGAESLAKLDLSPIEKVCQALALPGDGTIPQASTISIAPWVTASLVRVLADNRTILGDGLRIVQRPSGVGREGRGNRPRRRIVRQSTSPWPDCFRPSFRFPPSFTPLHVELLGSEPSNDDCNLTVIALASDWVERGPLRTARTWAHDVKANRVCLSVLEIDTTMMNRHSVTAGGDASWFPEGAGAWGRRLTLGAPVALLRSP